MQFAKPDLVIPSRYTKRRGAEDAKDAEERMNRRGWNTKNAEITAHSEDCISIHGSDWKIAIFPFALLCALCALCVLRASVLG